MQTMGFLVCVRVSDNVDSGKIAKEIKTSVGFGQAQVMPLFIFPDPVKPENMIGPFHEEPRAHDGYATHSHEVRPDHLGVHRKTWGENV